MNTQKPAVKYEFSAMSDTTDLDAIAQGKEKTEYLPTGFISDDKNKGFKFDYSFDVEADTEIDELDMKGFSSNDFAKFEAEIEKQDDSGKDIVSLNYGDGEDGKGTWNALFSETDSDVVYFSSDDTKEFEDLLDDAKTDDRNLSLLDLDYGEGTWIATYTDLKDKDPDLDSSDLESSKTFDKLTGQIDSHLDKGDASLVDIEYGDGLWFARYDSDPTLDKPLESSYFSSKDYETFQTEIETQKDEGFDLVDVEYIKDAWYGVFNESVADNYESALIADSNYEVAEIEASEFV